MISDLKRFWFKLKNRISDLTADDPIIIIPYKTYANENETIIRGRVIEKEAIVVKEDDGKWENFINSLKRMESDEIKEAKVCIRYMEKEYSCVSNKDGYFSVSIPQKIAPSNETNLSWCQAQLWLDGIKNKQDKTIQAKAEILLPHTQTQFAIITDIDDTILQSHVNSFMKLRLLYETFLKNIYTRKAFENIGPVLDKISKNEYGRIVNPLFFISHSPWNLYNLLEQFIKKYNIPKGPFFLRDFGYKRGVEKIEYENHKAITIKHLLDFYSDIPFVLIGDATEHDVDVYTKAHLDNPGRILKIIIRATKKEENNKHVEEIMAKHPNAPIYLIQHSNEILTKMNMGS